MILLILGLTVWFAAHLFKRVAPNARAALGSKGNMVMALVILSSVVMMIFGYRMAGFDPVYTPLPGVGHATVLLMLVALYVYGSGKSKAVLSNKLRHPMLVGTLIFVTAHLLVNGDLASVILFGGIGVWALVEMAVINRAEGPWGSAQTGTLKGDAKNAVITLVIFGGVVGLHIWSGHNPFVGTFP